MHPDNIGQTVTTQGYMYLLYRPEEGPYRIHCTRVYDASSNINSLWFAFITHVIIAVLAFERRFTLKAY